MNEREKLLRKVSTAQFAAWELHIYLDTHPCDKTALRNYEKYDRQYRALMAEYESKYGPLTPSDTYGDTSWEGVCAPWPWETNNCMEEDR